MGEFSYVAQKQQTAWQEYQTQYRQRHPEKVLQFRITAARNLLTKNGWTCEPPQTDGGSDGEDLKQ